MKFTAVIPVKAHSSRLPGKNLKPFGKENLLTRKIRQLKQSKIADRIILSSDSDEMLDIATKHGIEAIKRPIEFANESRPFGEFLDYISEIIKEGHMIYSCVTSPFFDENLMVKAKQAYIKALKDGLGANHILSISGILNGTSNYILSKMIKENADFASALKDAQHKGYAEKDPTLDINGMDAGHKLLILASLAYGIDAHPEDIIIEGIDGIELSDIVFAKEFGYVVKLLGIANKRGEEIELRAHPALVKSEEMIAKVDGVMNAVSVVGDCVGEMLYYGAGAGGDATASAVISDLIEIAREKSSSMLGFDGKNITHKLMPRDKISSRYYIRLRTHDRAGVLARVSSIFSSHDISIQVLLQPETKDGIAELLLITHLSMESKIINALKEIDKQDFIAKKTFFIRIQD